MKNPVIKKVLKVLTAIIIVLGITIIIIKGFNIGLEYQESKKMELTIEKEFTQNEIKEISKEVFPNKEFTIQSVETFNNKVAITTKDITDEEKNIFIQKINEKYGLEYTSENLIILNIAHINLKDIVMPYVVPTIIALAVTIAYFAIKFRKLGVSKIIFDILKTTAVIELVYFSLIAITRLPINIFTMPVSIGILIITMLVIANKYENK